MSCKKRGRERDLTEDYLETIVPYYVIARTDGKTRARRTDGIRSSETVRTSVRQAVARGFARTPPKIVTSKVNAKDVVKPPPSSISELLRHHRRVPPAVETTVNTFKSA